MIAFQWGSMPNTRLVCSIFNDNAQIDNKVYSPQWFLHLGSVFYHKSFQGVNGFMYHKTFFLLSKCFFINSVSSQFETVVQRKWSKYLYKLQRSIPSALSIWSPWGANIQVSWTWMQVSQSSACFPFQNWKDIKGSAACRPRRLTLPSFHFLCLSYSLQRKFSYLCIVTQH